MPARPEYLGEYPRRVLLAATGLSPQIVTETLYVLAVERGWAPVEVQLLTTRRGAEKACLALLADGVGWFHRLRQDYQLPPIAFGPANIHVITTSDGTPLDDILTDADNVAVADFITEHVRAITADPASSLNVSIAGGRKTMGFYVGYALSLFGRKQDRLSHVLVSPPFESLPDFFYPTPHRCLIAERDGRQIDASTGQVHLGDIPFVRLREGLPRSLLDGRTTFSRAVDEAQKALPPVALCVDPQTRTVTAAGEHFELPAQQFALYWIMVERCKSAHGGVHWSDPAMASEWLEHYGRLVGVNSGLYEQAEKAFAREFGKDHFDPPKARINRAIERALGERRALPYLIVQLDRIAGSRRHRFGLSLPPEAITIGPASLPAAHAGGNKVHIPSSKPATTRNSP
jgi:CRISPR-associated protein (TIGR02584 family)